MEDDSDHTNTHSQRGEHSVAGNRHPEKKVLQEAAQQVRSSVKF